MIKIDRAIVVEGKYDKIKLETLIDTTIVTTGGFDIYNNEEIQKLIRILAQKKGIVVLTDSDVAGFKIRGFISGMVPKEQVIHAYIPDLYGKEKRKEKASCEGKLGVEGVSQQVILDALTKAGALCEVADQSAPKITKMDFFEDGLSGGQGSGAKRTALIHKLDLPEHLTANSLLTLLNAMFTYEEYKKIISTL